MLAGGRLSTGALLAGAGPTTDVTPPSAAAPHLRAFTRFVQEQSTLAAALSAAAARDEQMLASMQQTSG